MRLIPQKDLKAEKGIPYSRVQLWRLVKAKQFPRPIQCGGNRIAFIESEIDDWILAKAAERDSEEG